MNLSDRLDKLENQGGAQSWADMCTARDRDMRCRIYQKALRFAADLGVTVELPEPPAPNPAALEAFNRKYGEAIKAEEPATRAKFERLMAGHEPTPGTSEHPSQMRVILDIYLQMLSEPERQYIMHR